MCGIAGLVLFKDKVDFDPETAIQAMVKALHHRGPDDVGFYKEGNIYLGHARLSIIDVDGGHQPLISPDGDAIIGNGEIYNYVELKEKIKFKNYLTQSDFEPALHICLETDPESGFNQWRGMYAATLHLAGSNSVFLARDHFGIKPLYYVQTEDFFAFASEPRALIAAGLTTADLNLQAVQSALNLNYVPFESTVYKDIKRALPGEVIRIGNTSSSVVTDITQLHHSPPKAYTSTDEALSAFDRIFKESILIHQRSDVPYGLFLSGGLDSTSILTMMARLNQNPVKTFTCGFDSDTVHDERDSARKVATYFNTDHHETIFTKQDFIELLPQVAWALDDPTFDPAVLPTYKLGLLAKDHVKVVLSGEGGDEVFGGYGRYRKFNRPKLFGGGKISSKPNLENITFETPWQNPLLPLQQSFNPHILTTIQAYDIKTWLPADLLLKLDRCLMAHSLEGRTPFLDKEVFEFGFNLPDALKIRKKQGKWLLRQWLSKHCPVADAFGRKKGFTVPVHDWIHQYMSSLLPLLKRNAGLLALMHRDQIELAIQNRTAAWPLLFYAVWHKVHIEGCSHKAELFEVLN